MSKQRNGASRRIARRLACASTAIIAGAGLLVPWSARAQTTPPASTPASADSATVEQVVVTAEFRQQNLQETPIAITALTGAALQARNLQSFTEVAQSVPNVSLRSGAASYGKTLQANIRGIGQTDFKFGLEPGVGVYVDDVYYSTVFGALFDLLDVDRVEILRGPQGTLFGKNTIGGAIRLISKQPRGDNSGYLEATAGSFKRVNVRGSIDVPIVQDKLAARLSAAIRSAEGYGKVLDYACAHPGQSGKLLSSVAPGGDCQIDSEGNDNVKALRASLRWTPSERVDVTVTGDYAYDDSELPVDTLLAIGPIAPGSPADRFNKNVAIPVYGLPFDSRFIITDDPYATYENGRNPVSGLNVPNRATLENWGVAATAKVELPHNLQLTSITAYRGYGAHQGVDQDASPLGVKSTYADLQHHQFSEELRVNGELLGGRIEWTGGVYYLKTASREAGYIDYPTIPLSFAQNDPARVENESAFLHTVSHITDKLQLTLSGRYTHESKSYEWYRLSLPSQTPLFGPGNLTVDRAYSFNRFTPRASLDYQWTPTIMTYASFSTGFRSGGFNPRPSTLAQVTTFGPEKVNAYEVGAKTEFFDHRLRANLAAFYSDYRDLQLSSSASDPVTGQPLLTIRNVGKARIEGIEAELQAKPTRALLLEGNVGYLSYRNIDLGSAAGVAGGPTLTSVPAQTPNWKMSGAATYTFDLANGSTLAIRGDIIYQSKTYNDAPNTELAAQDGYALLNGRITWTARDASWSVAVYGTNLTDKLYYNAKFISTLPPLTVSGNPGRPREFGVTLRRSF